MDSLVRDEFAEKIHLFINFRACMDLNRLELIGLGPVKDLLTKLGGWPVLEEDWNEELFEWWETNYKFRESGEFVIARAKKH